MPLKHGETARRLRALASAVRKRKAVKPAAYGLRELDKLNSDLKSVVDTMAVPRVQIDALDRFKSVRLDLGCGANKQPGGFLGIDARPLEGVDIVHDLEVFPWPLPDNVARLVVMSHYWEHITPKLTIKFMAELHRVCQHGAEIAIAAPYSTGFRFTQDPTHCNPSNEATFLYWDIRHPLWEVYKPSVFHLTYYEIIPAGGDRDFNARLVCCKPGGGALCTCTVPMVGA